ncbi:TPA: hypothetical protein DDZ10_03395 [Candidatus Uhrbacteria bacterium]|nr:hypothetical protein [Candidatus Uhrbacteria bacterium]
MCESCEPELGTIACDPSAVFFNQKLTAGFPPHNGAGNVRRGYRGSKTDIADAEIKHRVLRIG